MGWDQTAESSLPSTSLPQSLTKCSTLSKGKQKTTQQVTSMRILDIITTKEKKSNFQEILKRMMN